VSEICEAFSCTPAEAEAQDWRLVRRVFDYRNARSAIDLFNQKNGAAELAKHPHLGSLLLEMHRAQVDNQNVGKADVDAIMAANWPEREDDDA
jgi:hypothetical protein